MGRVSGHGFHLVIDAQERFLSFADFPWFREATLREITRVERPSSQHLYWPDLDVDLAIESIDHPERFPLISRAPADRPATAGVMTARERRATYTVKPAPKAASKGGRSRRG